MSVGNDNHYHVHEILPRHYHQTAGKAGVPDSMVETALGEIGRDLPAALDKAIAGLPGSFPSEIRDSIAEGALERLKVMPTAS